MKLVSDIKEFLVLNDFPSVNESILERTSELPTFENHTDSQLLAIKEDLSRSLYELEESYYSSRYR